MKIFPFLFNVALTYFFTKTAHLNQVMQEPYSFISRNIIFTQQCTTPVCLPYLTICKYSIHTRPAMQTLGNVEVQGIGTCWF